MIGVKVLVVGEAAGRAHPPWSAFRGPVGVRVGDLFAAAIRLRPEDSHGAIKCVNLLDRHQPREPGGSRFPSSQGRAAARGFLVGMDHAGSGPAGLILLGGRVAAAFNADGAGLPRVALVGWKHPDGAWGVRSALVVPHPSGRCRSWNDPRCRRRVVLALRAYLKGVLG